MLSITSVSGNIFHDRGYESLKDRGFERFRVSRAELEKSRIRRQTDMGTDIGLALAPGRILRHGDVLLSGGGKVIVVEQLPEKVISVRLKNSKASRVDLLVLVGHIIGNRHRPISIKNDVIYFPIQADSELEVFQRLFAGVIDDIELSVDEMVFSPHTEAGVHDHG